MNCANCGTAFGPQQKFCAECGTARPSAEPALQAPAAEAPAATPAAASPAAPTAAAPTAGAVAARLLTTPRPVPPGSGPLALVGPYALAGAVLVIAGSLFPLFSGGIFSGDGYSVSAWQVPVGLLFSDTPDLNGFRLGILLLSTALVAIPYATGRPLTPLMLLLIAAPAGNAAAGVYLHKVRSDLYPNLGFGLAMIMAGAILTAAEALIPCFAAIKERAP